MADRKLRPHFKDGKLPITAWRKEREQLEQEYKDIQTELLPLHADAKKLWAIHSSTRCSMNKSARTPRRGRKSRKSNTKEDNAY